MNHERSASAQWSALGCALAFFVLLLLPVGRTAEVPLVLAALLAIPMLRQARTPVDLRVALGLYAAYCVPALISAVDAVAMAKSWTTALASLRFVAFGIAMVLLLAAHARTRAVLSDWIAGLVMLWALDALVQAATGWSLGGRMTADRVSGVFGADDLKLGPVLAVLSPFVLRSARERWGKIVAFASWLLLAMAILLAGARAAWLMFVLVTLVLLWRELPRRRDFMRAALVFAVAGSALFTAAYHLNPTFAQRVERSMAALSGDRTGLDHALAGRLPIFETALAMGAAHPINGVGVRGFRFAYAEHAAVDDPWLSQPGGAALHPHQWLLELWAETGGVGVIAWFAGVWLAIRAWRRADAESRRQALAPGLALGVMLFPLNTHFAIYSSFWGLLFAWLLALYAAALARPSQPKA